MSYLIGEAARRVGVSASALRLWERQGLVRPVRTGGRYRLYSDADLEHLRGIRRLRQVDRLNAPGIRRVLRDTVAPSHADRVLDGRPLRRLRQPARTVGGGQRLVRAGDGAVLRLETADVRIEQLARDATELEPQLFVLAPGASSDGSCAHEGEEFLYLLSGELTVWVGDHERYRLRHAGDALTFPSTLPHRWRNDAGGETRLLWINTPPTF